MDHKTKNKLLSSTNERQKAVFKAIDIEIGCNSLERWTTRDRILRHIKNPYRDYSNKEITYFIDISILCEDAKRHLRWTKIGKSICYQIKGMDGQ